MVLTHTTNHTYAHPFPTVTLAYYLRYSSPNLNPFASHVLSTDTISSHVDPDTGRLHTTRIHLKKSRLPGAIFKLLPASITGGGTGSQDRASYILETTVVDINEGWMRTDSRNLNFTGVLSVVEQQEYSAPTGGDPSNASTTDVKTTVIFKSRLGEKLRGKRDELLGERQQRQQGWLGWTLSAGGWGTKGIQRTIESVASTKTMDQLVKSKEGMRIVLEKLRNGGGVLGVLEERRREKLMMLQSA